jgi:hypothetical protein
MKEHLMSIGRAFEEHWMSIEEKWSLILIIIGYVSKTN